MHDDTGEMIGTMLTFSPVGVFENATFLVKLVFLVILLSGLAAIVAAIQRRMSAGARSSFLALSGRIGLYAGVGGAAYTAMTTFMTAQAMHVTRFVIYEPEVLEAVYVLILGLLVYAVARYGNAGAKRS